MTVLSKEQVQKFHQGLTRCGIKSDFDEGFLQNNSLEEMYRLTLNEWIALFKNRLYVLIGSDFDWTLIGLAAQNNWGNSKQHSNYHWYVLADNIASLNGLHIAKVLFPDVDIADSDLVYLLAPKSYSSLIFNNSLNRLSLIQRILLVSVGDSCSYCSYDKYDGLYAISPFEAYQMNRKMLQRNIAKHYSIENWSQFREHYLDAWNVMLDKYPLEEVAYPLFRIVSSYFKVLENHESIDRTLLLINSFYTEVLSKLSIYQVNSIYGQRIAKGDRDEPIYFLEVLLSLMHSQKNPSDSLAIMVKFAVWLTHLNPAMVINHPLVNDEYHADSIGPFFTQDKLANEVARLFHFRSEFDEADLGAIQQLCEDLNKGTLAENDLFMRFWMIFSARDDRNRIKTFTDIQRLGILTGSYEYVYYRKGANAVFIRIAQILSGLGVLKRCGLDDYYQLLMPGLTSPVDSVTRELLSLEPLSHYARPEKDRTYLIFLGNSISNYIHNKQCFYNVNAERVAPFSLREYQLINAYSAKIYHDYPRIPKHTSYPLKSRTLEELVYLVNNSLYFEAAQDGDGYRLRQGMTVSKKSLLPQNMEYVVDRTSQILTYQVKDSWDPKKVHTGTIVFGSVVELNAFSESMDVQKLLFILHVAVSRGHARSNLSMTQYFRGSQAYQKFRMYYQLLKETDPDEFSNLNHVSMRFGTTVRSFYEVWANGFPDCMSAASKWFSTLVLDYLPDLKFCKRIETNKKFNEYLEYARRDSQYLYHRYNSNEAAIDLSRSLTHESMQPKVIAIETAIVKLLGLEANRALDQAEEARRVERNALELEKEFSSLLLIVDNKISDKPFCLFTPNKRLYQRPQDDSSPRSSVDLPDEDHTLLSSRGDNNSMMSPAVPEKYDAKMFPSMSLKSSNTVSLSDDESMGSKHADENRMLETMVFF